LRALLAVLCLVPFAAACSDDDEPDAHPCGRLQPPACDGSPDLSGCATAYYYAGYEPNGLGSCNPGEPIIDIGATVQTPLFRGEATADPDVAHQTRALQRYFEPHALWFQTDALSSPYPIRYVMRGSAEEINQALTDAGLPQAGLTPEQEALATRIAGEIIFAELRRFLADHARTGMGVNVVVIPEIVAPGLQRLLELDGAVVGFGISPALFGRLAPNDPGRQLLELLGIDTEFTPTLLVGHAILSRLLCEPDVVIAHEMGHALGLPHAEIPGNLMEPVASAACRGGLLAEQVALMGPFTAQVADHACTRLGVLQLHRRLMEKLLARRARGLLHAP
jgi:hypothetical protein